MTKPLSAAAQAVLDAAMNVADTAHDARAVAAAVLRAVVKEIKYLGITEKNILNIADELEGITHGTYRCDLETQ